LSWYSPKPRQLPKRLPRRKPIKVVPSGIGDEGIVGNWLFYYLKGGDHLHDFSSYDNHGTLTSTNTDRPKWVDGKCGWALGFDGTDDYVKVPDDPSLDITDEITIAIWVKSNIPASSYSKDVGLLSKNSWDETYELYLDDADNYTMNIVDAGTQYTAAGGSVDPDSWQFVVGTYDGETLKSFVDGSKVASTSHTGSIDTNDKEISIGTRTGQAGAEYLDGVIAIIWLYAVAKDEGWIKRRFERTKGIFGK